jgi:hypothetical protein
MCARKASERPFVDQLLGLAGARPPPYSLPVAVQAKLRPYQVGVLTARAQPSFAGAVPTSCPLHLPPSRPALFRWRCVTLSPSPPAALPPSPPRSKRASTGSPFCVASGCTASSATTWGLARVPTRWLELETSVCGVVLRRVLRSSPRVGSTADALYPRSRCARPARTTRRRTARRHGYAAAAAVTRRLPAHAHRALAVRGAAVLPGHAACGADTGHGRGTCQAAARRERA